jgi:acetyl esterase/lipase
MIDRLVHHAEIISLHGSSHVKQRMSPGLVFVDEADVLRDEGDAYAAKLTAAGVPVATVRYDGVVHDLMLLNAMSEANATRGAIAQATAFPR